MINKLFKYTTEGKLLKEISLDDSIQHPVHSIELSTGQFVVCHWGAVHHRVCIVDRNGQVVTSYGTSHGSAKGQLKYPVYLAVESNDNVLVADSENNKVRFKFIVELSW